MNYLIKLSLGKKSKLRIFEDDLKAVFTFESILSDPTICFLTNIVEKCYRLVMYLDLPNFSSSY